MTLTPFLIALLKDNYVDYRKEKAIKAGGVSPEMQARINVLNSQLSTRARIQPEQLNPRNKMVVHQLRLQKAAQQYDNKVTARNALTEFLQQGKPDSPAQALKDELEWLAGYILAIGPVGARWVPGPLKKIEKAMGKTIEDYDYAWGNNKDLVRGTLACKTNEDLARLATLVGQTCKTEMGMFLIKADNQKSIRDGGQVKSGYSGWNFVVQFKDHRMFGAEVQANTFDLLYGKHSKKEVIENLNVSAAEYSELQTRLRFPGGLGHALYDIQDTARSKATTAEGDWARELALDYNDACRGVFRNSSVEHLNERIKQGAGRLTSTVAKDLWKHAVEGSCWIYPIAH